MLAREIGLICDLRRCFPSLLGLVLAVAAGCQRVDEITRYTVPKPAATDEVVDDEHFRAAADRIHALGENVASDRQEAGGKQAEPGRLLGAIIPHGKTTWFFKLTGPVEAVELQRPAFERFVKSIRFSEKGPQWQLPEGWLEEPGTAMRFATLRIPSDSESLEMSVIPLPTGEGSLDAYLLSNVNRWRDQLQLPPLTKDNLSESAVKIEIDENPAWIVSFEGLLSPPGKAAPPFAGKAGPRRDAPAAKPSQASPRFTAQVPSGWTQAPAGAMQLATYVVHDGGEVHDGGRNATASVSAAGGDLAANVNRWRGQVQLDPLSAAELKKSLHAIDVDGNEGSFVELVGPEGGETILGVVVEARGRQWFIKLKGDSDLVAREKAHFEEFVRSLRFR